MLVTKKCLPFTTILGVRVDILSKNEALGEIVGLAKLPRFSYVVTVNPEQIYDAYYDSKFKKIVNNANLVLCDGTGVILSSYLYPPIIKERVTGSSILPDLLDIVKSSNFTLKVVQAANPRISREELLRWFIAKGFDIKNINVTSDLNDKSNANMILVAMQHKAANYYIDTCSTKLQYGVAINIGGSFDYLLGIQKTPNIIIKHFGLEWLYRFITRPAYRAKRVIKAVILFPLLVLSTRISLTLFGTK